MKRNEARTQATTRMSLENTMVSLEPSHKRPHTGRRVKVVKIKGESLVLKTTTTVGGRGGCITRSRDRDHPGQHGETPSLQKIQKINWARWRMPVIPATQEAEAYGSLEVSI